MDMDYYETLDILRPPVKRGHRDIQQQYIGYVISGSENVNLCAPAKFTKVEQKSAHKQHPVESSLSLILQKTCKKQILQKFSFINSDSPREETVKEIPDLTDKPLIRITILPKTDHKPLLKFHETHAEVPKNAIQSKNVYLVVAGSKNEKIYEINRKSCAKIIDKDVKELFNNINHNIKIKKMEKKKKKSMNGKKQAELDFADSPYICKCTKDNLTQDICGEHSQVKIVGRIGLNGDDEYVMRCAATVNGQPVSTQYTRGEKYHYQYDLADDKPMEPLKESQGTQVDIDIGTFHDTNDQNIQCDSYDVHNITQDNFDEESKLNNVKASNPLVIISVYPKQEINNFAVPTKSASPKRLGTQNYSIYQDNENKDFRMNTFTINAGLTSLGQSFSDRPTMVSRQIGEADRNDDIKGKNTITKKTKRPSRSPSPTNRSPKFKTQEHKKQNMFVETNAVKTIACTQSPNKININDKKQQRDMNVTKQNRKVIINQNKTEIRRQQNSTMRSESKYGNRGVTATKLPTNNVSPETNTKKSSNNKKKTMKKNVNLLVDDLTVYKKFYPNKDVSKISINIDSDREYYDVVFEKGRLTTDLSVRKTTKDNCSQKYFEENFGEKYEKNSKKNFNKNKVKTYGKNYEKIYDNNYESNLEDVHVSDSLENLFPLEVAGRHRRSVSQAFNNVVDGLPLSEHTSRINVRDSLEISHRRDGKDTKPPASKRLFEYSSQDNDASYTAPVKHFSGDSCCIFDPVARDKEIRELLGIDKKRRDSKQADTLKHKVCGKSHIAPGHLRETLCDSLENGWITKKNNSLNRRKEVHEDKLICNINSVPKPRKHARKEIDEIIGISVMKNQITQYDSLVIKSSKDKRSIQDSVNLEPNSRHKTILLSRRQYNKVKKLIHKGSGKRTKGKSIWNTCVVSVGNITAKMKSEYLMRWNKEVQTEGQTRQTTNDVKIQKRKESKVTVHDQINTVVLFSRDKYLEAVNDKIMKEKVRKIASSVEIRHTSLSFTNDVECSVTNSETLGSSKLRKKNKSIDAIFKGYKRSLTPNLGTSAFSLLTEDAISVSKTESLSPNMKPKKPFFRRLMSCLVLRSTVKIDQTKKLPPPATMNSSFDSYHISTSLGAIEVTSSLYDTSASFYSNHTINNKMKRGFFSSVREFLSTRKN